MKKIILLFLTFTSLTNLAQTPESYRIKAKSFFEKGNYKEAVSVLTLALKINPKDEKALKNRAISYERLQKFDLALKDNLELLKYEKSGETHGSIGYDYLWLDKYDEAKKYLNQAIKLIPNNIIYRYNLALSYQYGKNFDEAIKYYDEVLKISPEHSPSQISKTRCLLELNQFEKASSVVDTFFINKSFDVEMLFLRGDIKKHFGKNEEALNDFNRALAISPDDPTFLNRAADCLSDLKFYGEEVALRRRMIDLSIKLGEKDDFKALNFGMLGIAQNNALLWEDALESFNAGLKLDSTANAASIYFYRSIVKVKLKDNEGACNDLKKAQELNPTEADDYENYFADDAEFEEFFEYCVPNP